jgi:ligand-binding sensor domain-containing protein
MKKTFFFLFIFYSYIAGAQCTIENITTTYEITDIEIVSDTIWVATEGGIMLYDTTGIFITNIRVENGLSSNAIRDLHVDDSNNIWVASQYGVSKYNGEKWSILLQENSDIPNNDIMAITSDNNGELWISCRVEGVFNYHNGNWIRHSTSNGLTTNNNITIKADSNNHIWTGTTLGANYYNGSTWVNFTTSDGLGDNWITDIDVDLDGNIWVATRSGGVSCYDHYAWQHYDRSNGLISDSCNSITIQENGDIIVAGTKGYSIFSSNIWTTYGTDIITKRIIRDKHGNYWYGHTEFVLNKNGKYYNLFSENRFLRNLVWSTFHDVEGNLFVGTWDGLSIYKNDKWSNYLNDPFNHQVREIVQDQTDSSVWLATSHGVWKFEEDSAYKVVDPLINGIITLNTIYIDQHNNKWVGTYGKGALLFSEGIWDTIHLNIGTNGDYINAIYVDQNDITWFGTYEGLVKYKNGNYTLHDLPKDFIGEQPRITRIKEDPTSNAMWLVTTEGIMKFDGTDIILTIDEIDGLPNSRINDILVENDSTLWIASDYGLYYYSKGSCTIYNSENGLSSKWIMSLEKSPEGDLWVSTWYGGINVMRFSEYIVENISTCDHYITSTGDTLFESGIYFDTINIASDCKQIFEIRLTILTESVNVSLSACDGIESPSGLYYWSESGRYSDTLTNINGCDSVVIVELEVQKTFSSIDTIACDSFISPSGKIWTVSGTYVDTITNTAGCDSIIAINLIKDCSNSIYSKNILKSSLYPNPADENIIIELEELNNSILVEIFSLTGQLLFSEEYFNSRQVSIDLNIPQDIYLIKVTKEKGNSNLFKVLKQ